MMHLVKNARNAKCLKSAIYKSTSYLTPNAQRPTPYV